MAILRPRRVIVEIPQFVPLLELGRKLVAGLSNITTALETLSNTLESELTEIQAALANMTGPTQEEVDAVAQKVVELRDKIANIIP
jgi:hypothetical protein